jgi:anaerobic magnesium-protoporphyrin IX monomethyl ester cyclase
MKCKVLFIYTTTYKKTGLPIGIGYLCSALKDKGHSVKIFDTAFYDIKKEDYADKIRAERKMSKEVIGEKDFFIEKYNFYDDLNVIIKNYKPDIICFSLIESFFSVVVQISNYIKQNFGDILIVAGGVLPTLSPEIVINEKSIDVICIGEGEIPLSNLCEKLMEGSEIDDIDGLWVKRNGDIIKNKPNYLIDLDSIPHPCFEEFDEKLFYKPMQGKLYKMVNISTDRGCPFQCSFCAAPTLKRIFRQNNCGKYYRKQSIDRVIDQINFQIKKHDPGFIYFSSETFLGINDIEFDRFIKEYDSIKLPFWFQTRFETITLDRIKRLKDVGMLWLTIGLEHGNEEFRYDILKRKYSNQLVIEKAQILADCGIGASINNVIGFPFETRELIFDTINLNKILWNNNNNIECNIFLFTPYRGCQLRDVCVKENFIEESNIVDTTQIGTDSILNFPDLFKKELKGLLKTFNLYVKLPCKYYPDILIAEKDDEEGSYMFNKLVNILERRQNG